MIAQIHSKAPTFQLSRYLFSNHSKSIADNIPKKTNVKGRKNTTTKATRKIFRPAPFVHIIAVTMATVMCVEKMKAFLPTLLSKLDWSSKISLNILITGSVTFI